MGNCRAGEGEGSGMNTLKHTPAPWGYNLTGGKIKGPRGDTIACGIYGADVDLVLAAHDLLEALKHARMIVLASELPVDVINGAVKMYDAAIAKAEGKDMPESYAEAQQTIRENWGK